MHTKWLSVALGLGLVVLTACSSDVERENPFDPNGTGPKIPGRIAGAVYVQGLAVPSGLAVAVQDASGARVDGGVLTTDAQGKFTSGELTPAAYRVEVTVPLGNLPIIEEAVEVLPGQTTDLGLLVSMLEPPDGTIIGSVEPSDTTAAPADVRVVATRLVGDVGETHTTYTNASGAYFFAALLPGSYEVRADKGGFTPDLVVVDVASSTRDLATAETMRLYPASAVLRIVPSGGGETGALYTRTRNVDLVLLAFGGVNEMRFCESPELTEGGVEVEWRDYLAQVPFVLSPGEGKKTVYAQFRVMDNEGRERLRTETYSTSITFDETPPVVLSMTLAPDAEVHDGVRYLTGDPSSVPVEAVALDVYSRVSGVRFLVEDADPSMVPYTDLSASDTTAFISDIVALTPTDGRKSVGVQLRDGAGNESEVVTAQVMIDTTPPVLGDPALVVRGVTGSELTSQAVTLQIMAGADEQNGIDGPVGMRFGVEPAPSTGTFVPFMPEVMLSLSKGHGEIVQFYAVVADRAGNEVTAQSPIYRMNLLGTVRGVVRLEGVMEPSSGHAGTGIGLYLAGTDLSASWPAPVASGTSAANGAYEITEVPPGVYVAGFTHAGFVRLTRSPVVVSAGAVADLGVDTMRIARGGLAGTLRYGGTLPSDDQSGIVVTLATAGGMQVASAVTGQDGVVGFSGIQVGTYTAHARAAGYAPWSHAVEVQEDKILPINRDSPQGCEEVGSPPPACAAIVLLELSGDFRICDRDDPAPQPHNCVPVLYTNESQVLLGLEAAGALYIRYTVQDPANPGLDSFLQPAAAPEADPCATPPQEQCWNPFDPDTRYLVDVSARQGIAVVLVQVADAGGVQPLQAAEVVYDTLPPSGAAISIARGAAALLDGYTSSLELSLTLTAEAGADAAPLAVVRLSRDDVWDGDTVNADRELPYGGAKLFSVAAGDGPKDVYAWFCDAAGNCTAAPVSAGIILDTTPPTRVGTGRDIVPTGTGIILSSLVLRQWLARSTQYELHQQPSRDARHRRERQRERRSGRAPRQLLEPLRRGLGHHLHEPDELGARRPGHRRRQARLSAGPRFRG